MAQVLDYSAGFPGAQAIKRAGYAGAVRYIGFPDRRKCANRGELDDFKNNQVGMALVFENNAADWRGGEAQGQKSGRLARDHANAIGFSAARPIYMAVDQDVVTAAEFNLMVNYLRGAGSSLGGAALTGVYGEADVVDRARDAGVASWFWQTAAWSRGRRTTAHLFQHVGTVTVGGIACDINDVLADDWGQHNAGSGDLVTTQAEFNELLNKGLESIVGGDTVGKRNLRDAIFQGAAWAAESISATKAARDSVMAKVDSIPRPIVEFTAEQVTVLSQDLADSLGASLGTSLAADLLAEASRRLAGK